MRGRGSETNGHSLDEGTSRRLRHPFIEIRQCIQVKGGGSHGRKLTRLVDKKGERSEKYAAEGRIAGFALGHPDLGKAKYSNRKQQDCKQLHQHVPHLEADRVRQEGNPLVSERWIGRLRKPCEPPFIPGIEPVMSIVGSEKHMKVGIE